MGGTGLLMLVVVGGGALVLLLAVIGAYNRLVRLRNLVRESWADVTTELKRRYDLIPNLVESVKGYMAHERETMDAVTRAHAIAMAGGQGAAAQAQAENELTKTLRSLFALAENYPQLRAADSVVSLQRELANTEDRIQAARRFYNGNCRDMNNAVLSFPSSLVAGAFHFATVEYFEVNDAAVAEPVKVGFS
jgi:LemA protein